jgi:glycosyltransferase involved in cell wall biosynthesis
MVTKTKGFDVNASGDITLVCCSYNREQALRDTMASKMAVEGVGRILFVLDGSTDASLEYLTSVAARDPRVEVIMRPHNGLQATRNFALSQVTTPWVLFIDDDDYTPPDFALVLRSAAEAHNAAIAGAPWLNAVELGVVAALAQSRATLAIQLSYRSHPSTSTVEDVPLPFFAATILARTDVIRAIGYDPGYHGNSWREETDMFLRALEAGHRVVRSSNTYSWLEHRYSGGHDQAFRRIRTECWIAINEARFLRRHAKTLRQIDPQWTNVGHEWVKTMTVRVSALLSRLERRLPGFARGSRA